MSELDNKPTQDASLDKGALASDAKEASMPSETSLDSLPPLDSLLDEGAKAEAKTEAKKGVFGRLKKDTSTKKVSKPKKPIKPKKPKKPKVSKKKGKMKYSFIGFKRKNIFKKLTKIWLFYIIMAISILVLVTSYLQIQNEITKGNIKDIENAQARHLEIINRYDEYTKRLNFEISLFAQLENRNKSLQKGMINLLNLIPNQITITYMKIEDSALVLKGVTPSKQLFEFLLQKPLQSIFDHSYVNFFLLSDGWYSFVSISK